MVALDLRTAFPRSPFDELGGYPWLGRMLDKARAHAAGTGGGYSAYPCPGDRRFLDHFGLAATAIGQLVKAGASDDEILSYVQEHVRGGADAIASYRLQLVSPYKSLPMRIAVGLMRRSAARAIRARNPAIAVDGLVTFAMILTAEEGYPVPVPGAI